ncbi:MULTISPECIES: tetratricopeptide repeat protein [Amycolatopsis]|uniref:Tetratricopeptide repeat protein n=1 Tax=Amycolatopsis albidoflavus TaxID=102226 RepID=A0ABW5IAT9_9PSEU
MDTTAQTTPSPFSVPATDLATCTPSQLALVPLGDAGHGGKTLPESTIYFPRKLDEELDSVVAAAAGGTSRMATLIGDPATGKKRALWEAIRAKNDDGSFRLYGWRIWPGLSPCTPEELLDNVDGLTPRTALWLPSADRYLMPADGELGEKVARCLRNLLDDETRAPCLILATLSRERWQAVNASPDRTPPGQDRTHALLLLQQGARIRVPDSFTKAELVRAHDSPEPRLAEAAESAPDGRVIQNLVAEPELRTRCRDIGPPARALLHFVIEARHAGHGQRLPRELLYRAFQSGLGGCPPDSAERFAEALSELTGQVPGGAAILVRDSGTAAAAFCLAASLERHYVTGAAKPVLPDERLWPVLLEKADAENCLALARECENRCLLELSARFYVKAAEGGCPRARTELAAMLTGAGRIDDAISQYDAIVRTSSDPADVEDAIGKGAGTLFAAKRARDVLDWLGPLAAEGNHAAEVLVALAHTQLNQPHMALAIHQRLAEKGDLHSAAVVAESIAFREDSPEPAPLRALPTPEELGEEQERRQAQLDAAVRYLNELGERTGFDLLPMITDLTVDAIGPNAAVAMLSTEATLGGRHDAYLLGARVLACNGRVEDALDWVLTARQYDVPGALAAAVEVNLSAGLNPTAQQLALECAAEGDAGPLIAVGDALSASGLPRKALDCYYEAAEHEPRALGAAALAAAQHGLFDDATAYYRNAQRAGNAPEPADIALLLCAFGESRKSRESEYSGPVAKALRWHVENVPLTVGALTPIAQYITDLYAEDLVQAYRTRMDVSRAHAQLWVADALVHADSVREDGTDRATASGSGVELSSSVLLVVASGLYSEAANAGSALAKEKAVRLLLKRQSFAEAARLLDSGRAEAPARLQCLLAEALAGLGDLDEAERLVEQQIADGDFSAVAGVARGFLLHGKLDTAPENLGKARENRRTAWELAERGVRGGDIDSHVLLADLRRNERQPGGVLELYCTAVAHGHPGARVRIDRFLAVPETADWNHKQFRKYGLDPRGEIAGGWSVPDSREAER